MNTEGLRKEEKKGGGDQKKGTRGERGLGSVTVFLKFILMKKGKN